MWKSIMAVSGGFILLLIVVVLTVDATYKNISRSCMPWSNLSCGESRIEGIVEEYLRRVTELQENLTLFRACYPKKDCRQVIFDGRDKLIRETWPTVFDRLSNRLDWQSNKASRAERDLFIETRTHYGPYALRNFCVPRIKYLDVAYEGASPDIQVFFRGFDCHKIPAIPESL